MGHSLGCSELTMNFSAYQNLPWNYSCANFNPIITISSHRPVLLPRWVAIHGARTEGIVQKRCTHKRDEAVSYFDVPFCWLQWLLQPDSSWHGCKGGTGRRLHFIDGLCFEEVFELNTSRLGLRTLQVSEKRSRLATSLCYVRKHLRSCRANCLKV